MTRFVHRRHTQPSQLARPRELIVACAATRSNVNLSRIVRACGCCGITKIICCGQVKIDPKIARDAAETVNIEIRRSLPAVLRRLRDEGYHLTGLEQADGSRNLTTFSFVRKSVLVVGNEREGLSAETLSELDEVVEIPVFGQPASFNVATATAIALYEYCRQFPDG